MITQPALHVFSYTRFTRQEAKRHQSIFSLDREMRRFYKDYETAASLSEERLIALTERLGGRIFLPTSTEEALNESDDMAADIGAQYLVTYVPKRPIKASTDKAPRRVEVVSVRVGLHVHALRNRVNL